MASSFRKKADPYFLYLRHQRPGYINGGDDKQGAIFFVFCQSRADATAKVHKWTYSSITHSEWRGDYPNLPPRDSDVIDDGCYGCVDATQVETAGSELRRIIDLDMIEFTDAWHAWRDAKAKEKLAQGKGKGREQDQSKAIKEVTVTTEEHLAWQGEYLKEMAEAKIDILTVKKLLK